LFSKYNQFFETIRSTILKRVEDHLNAITGFEHMKDILWQIRLTGKKSDIRSSDLGNNQIQCYIYFMNFYLDIVSIAMLFAGIQGLFLSLFLRTHKRGMEFANRILAVIVFFFSLSILLHTAIHAALIPDPGFHPEIIQVFILLINPHVYLYARVILFPEKIHLRGDIRHGNPFVAGMIILFLIFTRLFSTSYISILQFLITILVISQTVYYLYRIYQLFYKSNVSKPALAVHLKWVRLFIFGYLVFWVIAALIEAGGNAIGLSWHYGWLVVSIFIYTIGYMGLRKPEIFSGEKVDGSESNLSKYEKSTLTEALKAVYLDKLLNYMQKEAPFLEPGLSLADLAGKLNMSTHHLSQIINQHFGQNFFDYINEKRVEKAKELLLNPSFAHLNITAIAFEAGFNSSSTFNAAFKKHTGMTPTQFKTSQT
jgi:AraC-like DNA-binding protein